MDKILAAQPLTVPTMLVDSLWDQEDIYGAMAVYRALKDKPEAKQESVIWWWGRGITGRRLKRSARWGR